jgi:CHASE3 domain sensor protein
MSFSYTCRPADNKLDEMRFLLSDNNEETHLIENEELQYLMLKFGDGIDVNNVNMNAACAAACDIMASTWAKKQTTRTSNYNSEMDNVFNKLIARGKMFRQNSVTSEHFVVPSISVTDKQTNVDDTDAVDPSFRRNLFDNPQAPSDPYDEATTLT